MGLSALALLAAFAFLAGAAEVFGAVTVDAFGAVRDRGLRCGAGSGRLRRRAPGRGRLRRVVDLALVAVVLVVAELADSPLAASFSDATAVSSALVAVLIAVSADVSALADVPAWVAAVLSLVAAVVTLVAAAETVRGVGAPALLAVVVLLPVTAADLLAAVLPAPFLLAAVRPAPVLLAAVLLAAGRAAVRALVAVAGLAAAARVAAGLLAASVVPGVVAVVFVGTDLPPDMDQLRGPHSTERNLLHLTTRKNNGKTAISVTQGHSSCAGSSPLTIRSASSGDAPRPTATPMR